VPPVTLTSIIFANGINSSPTDIIAHFNQIADAEGGFISPDTAVYTLGDFTYTVGFTDSGAIVDTLIITENGLAYATISDINISTVQFAAALAAEESGTDTAAIENIVLGMNWSYVGNDNDDILLESAISVDGVALNFAGNDLIVLNGGNDEFALGDGNDIGHGGAGADTLYGGDGDDDLYGNDGKDTLRGGAGDDLLSGGNGKDKLIGGADWDVASYEYENEEGGTQGIVVDMGAGTIVDTFGKTDTIKGIEEVWGSVFDDVMTGSSEDEAFWGNDGDDQLFGKKGADFLDGGDGDDLIKGGKGLDYLIGGSGDDTLKGGKGQDFFEGGEGDDIIKGGSGFDVALYDDEHFEGGNQGIVADLETGIVIDTFGDTDTLTSIAGIGGSIFDDTISGSDADEEFRGSDGNDTLRGKKGADILLGQDGDDELFGGKGSDELDGGRGDDILVGGAGADLFIFALGGGDDVIIDFEVGVDEVQFIGGEEVTPTQVGDDVLLTAGDATMLILNASVADFLPV